MGEYLYTGAWQLCGQKDKDCFGMVAGTVQLSSNESVHLSFDVPKVRIEDDEDEVIIALPEIWARVLAEELGAVLIRSDHLHKLYKQGRLATQAVYSEESDRAALAYEHSNSNLANLAANFTAGKVMTEIQTEMQTEESFVIYDRQDHTKVGSLSAFGSTEGISTVLIRLSKAATRRISIDDCSLNIEIPRSICEDIPMQLREAVVKLGQLRWLKRYGYLSEPL